MASPTKNQTLTTTVKTTGKIIKNRFVDFNGQLSSGSNVLGVAMHDADENQALAVEVVGVTVVQADASYAISAGMPVMATSQGLAKYTNDRSQAVGIALSEAQAYGDLIKVLLR